MVDFYSNSQSIFSTRLCLGDIDGDQIDELIEIDRHHLYVFKCDFDHTPVLEHVMASPVKRLIIDDFVTVGSEKGKDQIFAILKDGTIHGWAISDGLKAMWWWFTQSNFIKGLPGDPEIKRFFHGIFSPGSGERIE